MLRLFTDGGRIAGALGYDRERGRFRLYRCKAIVLATGGIGRAYSITSNSWEYTGDGHALAYHAGAALQDMEFVQFHPDRHDLAAQRARHPGDRGRAGRRRRAAQQPGPALHVRRHPGELPEPDRRQRGGGLALHPGRQERPPAARAADPRPRRPLHHARGARGAGQPARRRLPRHLLDQGAAAQRAGAHHQQAPQHVPPVQAARRHRHHHHADGGRADHALRHGRHPGGRRHARCPPCPGCSPPASAPPGCTAPTGSAATRSPTCWCSASGRASTRPVRAGAPASAAIDQARGRRRGAARARAVRARRRRRRRRAVPGAAGAPGDDAGPGRDRADASRRWSARSRASDGSRSGRRR